MDKLIRSLTIHCQLLKDPVKVLKRFNATSDEYPNEVLCGTTLDFATNSIYFMESEQPPVVRVVYTCLQLEKKQIVPAAPDAAAPG